MRRQDAEADAAGARRGRTQEGSSSMRRQDAEADAAGARRGRTQEGSSSMRRQDAEADAAGARRGRTQADLFAAEDASPAPAPASALSSGQREALRSLKAGGMPPTLHAAGHARSRQLWYAVVFPEFAGMEDAAAVLQRLCLHAQRFTSFVSIEPPNALLLEIRGSLRLFGSLDRLQAGIDTCWQQLALSAHSATAPAALAALWIARGGHLCSGAASNGAPPHIEDFQTLSGHLAKLPIACTAW